MRVSASVSAGGSVSVTGLVAAPPEYESGYYATPEYSDSSYADLASLVPSVSSYGLMLSATVTRDVADATQPAGMSQTVGWRVRVNGDLIDPDLFMGPVDVDRSVDRYIQSATLAIAAIDGDSVLGNPMGNLGAAITGKKPVDISLAYRTALGSVVEEPVMTSAIAHPSSRSWSGAPVVDALSLQDSNALSVNGKVTYQLPPGSGVRRNKAIRDLLIATGASGVQVGGFEGRINKTVDLVKGDGVALAQAWAEIEGGHLLRDRRGNLVAKFERPEVAERPIQWVFGPDDVVISANGSPVLAQVESVVDSLTAISLRGFKQVLGDPDGSGCGQESVPLESVATAFYNPPPLEFQQSPTPAIVQGDLWPPSELPILFPVVQSRTLSRVMLECGEVVGMYSETFSFANPLKARYRRDGTDPDAPVVAYSRCHLESDADDEIGRSLPAPRIMKTGVTEERKTFDAEGWLTSEFSETQSLFLQAEHLKSRASVTDPWETSTHENATYWDLGNGKAVTNAGGGWEVPREVLQVTGRKIIDYERDGGILARRVTKEYSMGLKTGSLYLFHNGTFGEPTERLQLTRKTIESWKEVREGVMLETVSVFGAGGEEVDPPIARTVRGQPPAAPRRPGAEPIEASDTSDDAKVADRFEQEEIEASVSALALEGNRPKNELPEVFFEWAENTGELVAPGRRLILLGAAEAVTFSVPANGRVEEGQWGRVRVPALKLNHEIYIRNVRHSGELAGPKLTTIRAVAFPSPTIVAVN